MGIIQCTGHGVFCVVEDAFGFLEHSLDRPTTTKKGIRGLAVYLKARPDANPHESTGR